MTTSMTSSFDCARCASAEHGTLVPRALFWLAVTILFLIVHVPHHVVLHVMEHVISEIETTEWLHSLLTHVSGKYARSNHDQHVKLATESLIVPLKTLGFIGSVAVLLTPILAAAKNASWIWNDGAFKERCVEAALIFAALSILVIPRFLQSLGDEYGRMSLSPFTEANVLYYRRFLMPALAHTVGVSGYILYFFFSLLCTAVLIFLTRLWFETRRVPHTLLVSLSVATSSFAIFNFQMPGYPEQLGFILLLICYTIPMNSQGRLATIALSLAVHEALVFVLVPLLSFLYPPAERKLGFIILAIYGCIFVLGHSITGYQFAAELTWIDERGKTALQYFLENPMLSLAGVFFAYKLLWLLVPIALYSATTQRRQDVAAAIVVLIVLPLFTLPLAVDASRLVGFGFIGLFIAVYVATTSNLISESRLRWLCVLNLIVPSAYVGLNSGVLVMPGVYKAWSFIPNILNMTLRP